MRRLPMVAVRRRAHLTPHAPAAAVPAGPTQTLEYAEDAITDFKNPERGWYEYLENSAWYGSSGNHTWGNVLPSNSYIAAAYPHSVTLGMRYVRLDDFRDSAIPQWVLDSLWNEFAAWRSTDMKAILRFAYNRSRDAADAPYSRVLEHLDQLAPLLHEYTDVIALLQSGFVGAWGEWHSSTNSLVTYAPYRNGIVQKLFDATPPTMMIDQRYPWVMMHFWGEGTSLAHADRFTGTNRARHGHKNDAWATSEHMTTYTGWDGPWSGEDERAWAAAQSQYTTMGGESNRNTLEGGEINEWSDYEWIKGQKELLNMDYLSSDYYEGILNKWGEGTPNSPVCIPEFSRRLGYRLVLNSVTAPTSAEASGSMTISINMSNVGFGKVYKPRPIDLILVGAGGPFTVRLTSDARRDLPLGGATETLEYTPQLPSGLQGGQSYALFLRLPDPSSHLAGRPGSCVRLANTGGLWDSVTGRHDLRMSVTVS